MNDQTSERSNVRGQREPWASMSVRTVRCVRAASEKRYVVETHLCPRFDDMEYLSWLGYSGTMMSAFGVCVCV